jgi:hypothetical protein
MPGARELALAVLLLGCDGSERMAGDSMDGGTARLDASLAVLPYATEVVRFTPGDAAGFGQNKLPGVVLGPPSGRGFERGSLDVLSLGVGGEIVLGFGDRSIVDGSGADFVVFENAFFAGGDPSKPFAEPGEVSVSEDGETWVTFACDAQDGDGAEVTGCAGVSPTLEFDAAKLVPIDPEKTGGDAFDLADVSLREARFVRIRDLSETGVAPSAGFDLDAVGIIHD